VQIVLQRRYIYREKKLLVSLLIVIALYSLQSVKWEIRYFLYLPFFVSFLMFLKWEEKPTKYRYSIYALCFLQFIAGYAMASGYALDRLVRSADFDIAFETDFS
jgi:hypothetical protein